MKLIYVWDAHCGWCYGFEPEMQKFVKLYPELELEMISGGLFVGTDSVPIGKLGYIKGAIQKIKKVYDVIYSEKYFSIADEGSLVLNSIHPAIAFKLLMESIPNDRQVEFASDIQKQFFVDGKSLSEIETYHELFEKYDIPEEKLALLQENWNNEKIAYEDYHRAMELGVEVFPTLYLEIDGKRFDMQPVGATVEQLNSNYKKILDENLF